jgi:hypothetical protein
MANIRYRNRASRRIGNTDGERHRARCVHRILFLKRTNTSPGRLDWAPTRLGPLPSLPPDSAIACCRVNPRRRASTPERDRSRSPGTVLVLHQLLDKGCSCERPALQTSYGRSCHLRRGHRTGSEPRIACALRPTGCAEFQSGWKPGVGWKSALRRPRTGQDRQGKADQALSFHKELVRTALQSSLFIFAFYSL